MAAILGIDPGAKGALAVHGAGPIRLFDAPMVLQHRGKSKKPTTDIQRLCALAAALSDLGLTAAVIERVWGVAKQGASTGAALGHARGCLEVAFAMAGIPVFLVSPQRWKADLGLFRKPKDAALQLAIDLFPDQCAEFRPVRGVRDTEQCIGRADAALIAHHAATFGLPK